MNTQENSGIMYSWQDAPDSRAVLLLVHGLGAHAGRWELLSRFMSANGISSYAIELKGFGRTKDLKGHIGSFNTYFSDIRNLVAIIRERHPQEKIFILGESLGGLIAFLLAIRERGLFAGFICISPAFKSRLKFPVLTYIKIFISFIFNSRKQFLLPFNAQMCTRDTEYQILMEADPREHRLASSSLLVNALLAQFRAAVSKSKLAISALFLVAEVDSLVDPRASLNIFKKLKVRDKTIIHYPGMYHALSIELGREKVFADILRWIQARISGS